MCLFYFNTDYTYISDGSMGRDEGIGIKLNFF